MIRRTSSRKLQDAITFVGKQTTKKERFARYRVKGEPPKVPMASHAHFCASDDQSVFSYKTEENENLSIYAYSIDASSIGGNMLDDDDDDESLYKLPPPVKRRYEPAQCAIPMTVCLSSRPQHSVNHDSVKSQDLFYDGQDDDEEEDVPVLEDETHLSSEPNIVVSKQQQSYLAETDDSSFDGETAEDQVPLTSVSPPKKTVSMNAPARRSRLSLIGYTFSQSSPALGVAQTNAADACTATSKDNSHKRTSFWSSVRIISTGTGTTTSTTKSKSKKKENSSNNWLSFRKSKTAVITVSLKKSQGMKKKSQRRLMIQQQEQSTEELSSNSYRSERRASF